MRRFSGSAPQTTTTKIEAARNNMPFEGPGTGLANPSVLFHLSISQLAYLSVFRLVTVIGLSGVQFAL